MSAKHLNNRLANSEAEVSKYICLVRTVKTSSGATAVQTVWSWRKRLPLDRAYRFGTRGRRVGGTEDRCSGSIGGRGRPNWTSGCPAVSERARCRLRPRR
jgi:hypothetical protein